MKYQPGNGEQERHRADHQRGNSGFSSPPRHEERDRPGDESDAADDEANQVERVLKRPASSTFAVPSSSVPGEPTAIASFIALILSLRSLGESACDVYCGPVAVFYETLLLLPLTAGLWLVGLVASSVAVGVNRSRSRLGWPALAMSLLIPAATAIAVWNSGIGSDLVAEY
ncbi:MAG: hypothetical protein M3N46_09735 [Actinomycetota bacterium]|nr:hypothetical protein [Actinomycetota bacterium]